MELRGRGTVGHFLPLGLQKSMKTGSDKFLLLTTFALLVNTQLPSKFQEFFFDRFLEILEREMLRSYAVIYGFSVHFLSFSLVLS